ncbi:hypothetical protein [Acinetobacter sp.]|uniref:hypothetical protein n=1 Tax=Acinetobacter sp. TaxID=472 RepID=UPI0031D39DF5
MKKIAIMATLLSGFAVTAIGCTSHEAQQAAPTTPVEQNTIATNNPAPAQDNQSSDATTTPAPASAGQ